MCKQIIIKLKAYKYKCYVLDSYTDNDSPYPLCPMGREEPTAKTLPRNTNRPEAFSSAFENFI